MNPMTIRSRLAVHGALSPALKTNIRNRVAHPFRQAGRALFGRAAFLGLLAVLLGAGCASAPKDTGFSTEKMLVAAGFTFKEAQTPGQLEKLRKLPQEQLIHHELKGEIVYLYASAEGCRCLYAGDEEAYSRFQDLHREAKLNAGMHKGKQAPGGVWSSGQDWASYINDLGSGMIPGY